MFDTSICHDKWRDKSCLTTDNEFLLYGDPMVAPNNHNLARPADTMIFIFVATLFGPKGVVVG